MNWKLFRRKGSCPENKLFSGGLQAGTKKFVGVSRGAGWSFNSSSITRTKAKIFVAAVRNLSAIPQYV
jgi:hypothetical protein